MSDYKPKEGDRVRVVLEGTVTGVNSGYGWFNLRTDGGLGYAGIHDDGSVEKIEPPVEVFKPGDVVRDKATSTVRALGENGYVILQSGFTQEVGALVSYGNFGYQEHEFTSERFEKVDLG